NTVDLETDDYQLDSPEALRRFLTGQGLLDTSEPVGPADLALAVELREALRAMLRGNDGEPLDPAELEVVNRAAAGLPLQVAFDGEGHPVLGPGSAGCRGALAALLAGGAQARAPGPLGAPQGPPARVLPVGLLRPVQEPLRPLVLDAGLRQPHQDPHLPQPPPHRGIELDLDDGR